MNDIQKPPRVTDLWRRRMKKRLRRGDKFPKNGGAAADGINIDLIFLKNNLEIIIFAL